MRRVLPVLGVAVLGAAILLFPARPAGAWGVQQQGCPNLSDFLTGGGFIITTAQGTHAAAKANFGVGGACKPGGDGHILWGHLEYIDHGSGLNVHWQTITAYRFDPNGDPGARLICGTARTNDPNHPSVNFAVRVADDDEPTSFGGKDKFDIQLQDGSGVWYKSFVPGVASSLGDSGPGGGQIELHKPNPSFTGGTSDSCPAFGG